MYKGNAFFSRPHVSEIAVRMTEYDKYSERRRRQKMLRVEGDRSRGFVVEAGLGSSESWEAQSPLREASQLLALDTPGVLVRRTDPCAPPPRPTEPASLGHGSRNLIFNQVIHIHMHRK